MKKTLIAIGILLLACSRDSIRSANENLVKDKIWKTYEYKRNGTTDASVVSQQPTFQLRSDAKLYFSQINPVFRDTLNYQFMNNDNIKLTKPWISTNYSANLKIDRLTADDFDFTLTDNQAPGESNYKTTRQ